MDRPFDIVESLPDSDGIDLSLSMPTGPVFVIAAPVAGASRVARWLGQRGRARVTALNAAAGEHWRQTSDRWRIEPSALAASLSGLQKGRLARFESDPVLALNVDQLARWFPAAKFLYLYRDVRENLARMLHAWDRGARAHDSGVTLRDGRPWCLTLPPAWSRQSHRTVEDIVAWQWAVSTHRALDALQALSPDRWVIASFDRLLAEPASEHRRLRLALGLPTAPVRNFTQTNASSPDARLWQPYAERMSPVLATVAAQADRAVRLFADAPTTRITLAPPSGPP